MLKLKKINLLTKNNKIHNKSEHGCVVTTKLKEIWLVLRKEGFFFRGWLFVVWEGSVGIGKKKEK
jgi:hypothetical protein